MGLGVIDYLPDEERLALVAAGIFGTEPVKAGRAVIGFLLLWQEQQKAPAVGILSPAGLVIVVGRRLLAAVQGDHQRHPGREIVRPVEK